MINLTIKIINLLTIILGLQRMLSALLALLSAAWSTSKEFAMAAGPM